jgi:archaellum component FlaC
MTTEERLLRLENAFTTLVELSRNMDERIDDSNERQSTLENNLSALENNLTALSQIVIELAQAQQRTDERLDRLAALFERHISEHDES